MTVVVAGPGLAFAIPTSAFADPPGPTDYRSEIRSVVPETPAIEMGVIGGDAFLELRVAAGTEAVVIGYEGESYLWFRADGVVYENQNSPATYLNTSRYGGDGVPATVRPDAEPIWHQVSTGGYWAWHDHRAHWMQSARPVGFGAGDQILEAVIPVVVDGADVDVTVTSTWQPEPSPLALWFGVVAGLGLGVGLWFLRGRRFPPIAAVVPLAVLTLGVGAARYLSLPGATGPRPIWIVLPTIAVVSAVVGAVLAERRMGFAADAALLLVGVELAVWGYLERDGLSAAIIPTAAPFWLDRFSTAFALAGGLSIVVVALWWLFAVPAGSSTADAVSDSREPQGSPRRARP